MLPTVTKAFGVKHGYSNILGELVLADVLDYGDCEDFQIVCPNCREPLFKRIRSETHYFAHYQESKSLHSECELRVRNFTASDIDAKTAFARDQRLRYFLEQTTVLLRECPFRNPEDVIVRETAFRRLRRTPEFRWWAQTISDWLRRQDGNLLALTREHAASVYERWERVSFAPKTTFSREQQERAAADMLMTFATPLGRQALDKALNTAWVDLSLVTGDMAQRGASVGFSGPISDYMRAVLNGPDASAAASHHWLLTSPMPKGLHPQQNVTWSAIFLNQLTESLVEALLMLDYMGSLRKRARTAH
ncbi:hypothetical protein CSW60_21850 [Caulobacter sp. X]|nr:hypothetical protein CSW60_21850 [Caulobacter sp. X]